MSEGGGRHPRPALAERIAAWSSAVSLPALPPEVVAAAKRAIVDTVGVALAAAPTELVRRLHRHAMDTYVAGPAGMPGLPGRLSPVGAALVVGTAAHALDFDDTSYTGIMHGSAVILPAALAATETAGGGGRRLIEAFVAGSEVAYAVALACGTGHYRAGWWSTATFGAFGAAAAAARAFGLGAAQTAHALAIAGAQATGQKAVFGTDAKPLMAGRAAASGVESALLARQGVEGPVAVLEGARGFAELLNQGRLDPLEIERLGRVWRLVQPGLLVKQFPVCSGAHAAAEATRMLLREHRIAGEEVCKLRCYVPPTVAISLVYDRPATPQQAQFSLPFAIGAMLTHGEIGLEQLSPAALAEPRLQRQMAKVEMRRDDALHADASPEGARVTMVTADGREYTATLMQATGMPERPLADAELHAKFLRCAAAGGTARPAAQRLLAHLLALESAPVPFPLLEEAS